MMIGINIKGALYPTLEAATAEAWKVNTQKMLLEGLTGAGNRFQRAYANAGAIHIGDNEMIGMFDKTRLNENDKQD